VSSISGTYLFTDIEGSTLLWEDFTDAMAAALGRHDEIVDEAIARHAGRRVKHTGDGMLAVFTEPWDAVAAALEAQTALHRQTWQGLDALRVRMGIHAGTAEERAGDLFGPNVNRAARLMAAARGGSILLSDTVSGAVWNRLPAGGELVDLGHHRLRPTTPPERVFFLRHPDLPAEEPALAPQVGMLPDPGIGEPPPTSNLGRRLSSFVGRRREQLALGGMLEGSRAVTVTGPAGVGKTSLAAVVARDLGTRFPDGVVAVKLGGAAPVDDVADHTVDAFGLAADTLDRRGRRRNAGDVVVDHIAQRRMLLLLDNCEHVLESARWYVPRWLAACPNLAILATSRQPLRIPGEVVMPLGPLTLPTGDTPTEVAGSEAGVLLLERLGEARPSFLLTERTAPVLAALCRRLDGLPLALELVAARSVTLPVEEILRRIDHGFDLLERPGVAGDGRQRTLSSAVEWSWNLLTDPERRALTRLTVCATSFDLEFAEAVVGDDLGDHPIELVSSLIEQSLVHGIDDPIGRFRLLGPIHEFAADRLEAVDGAGARDRHADHLTTVGTEAVAASWSTGITGSSDGLLDLRSDIVAAFEWSLGSGRADRAAGLASALGLLDLRTGTVPDAVSRIDHALALGPITPRRRVAALLMKAAVSLYRQEDADDGLAAALEAMELSSHDIPDVFAQAQTLAGIGHTFLHHRDIGLEMLERSREGFLAEGAVWASAFCAAALGEALRSTSPGGAKPMFQEAIAGFDEMGDVWGMAWAAGGLARILKMEESIGELDRLLDRVASKCDRGQPDGYVILLTQAVMAACLAGELARGRTLAERAADIAGHRMVPYTTAVADLALGVVARHFGDEGMARILLDRARRLLDSLAGQSSGAVSGIEIPRLEVEYHLGRVIETAEPERALHLQVSGLRRSVESAETWSAGRAMLGVAAALAAGGDPRAAEALGAAEHVLATAMPSPGGGFRSREWEPVEATAGPSRPFPGENPVEWVLGLAPDSPPT
jgi:predicted ATPase/class 3 adenylate cyclase